MSSRGLPGSLSLTAEDGVFGSNIAVPGDLYRVVHGARLQI